MSLIGLLMTCGEDDILPFTLPHNASLVDHVYALSGGDYVHCRNLAGVWYDNELPKPPYPEKPRDGYRQFIYEKAVQDHGFDNWFLLLHGDELWRFDPVSTITAHPDADGLIFRLPCHVPRYDWLPNEPVLQQLRARLEPGYPEFRMFHGNPDVRFDPYQHFNVTPHGLTDIQWASGRISHYPYRSPANQRARAQRHELTGFDPDNYRHVTDRDEVIWTDEMVARACESEWYDHLAGE